MQCLCLLYDQYISKLAWTWLLPSQDNVKKKKHSPDFLSKMFSFVPPYYTNQRNKTLTILINDTPDLELYVNYGKQIAS